MDYDSSYATRRIFPASPFSAAACALLASFSAKRWPSGIDSFPDLTASAMCNSTRGSAFTGIVLTEMEGYSAALVGALSTDAKTPPCLSLPSNFVAVGPLTVSAMASSNSKPATAVSSSSASMRSAPRARASSICPFRTPAITVAPFSFATKTAERPTFPAAPDTNRVPPLSFQCERGQFSPGCVVSVGAAATDTKSIPSGADLARVKSSLEIVARVELFLCNRVSHWIRWTAMQCDDLYNAQGWLQTKFHPRQ